MSLPDLLSISLESKHMLIIRDGRNTVNRKKKKTAAKREASAAGGCIIPVIVFRKHTDKLEFARRAGGQVVRKICVVVSALTRSVSFFSCTNWNLAG